MLTLVACVANPVTGTMVRTPETEVAVAPPDETAVAGARGPDAALVAGAGCEDDSAAGTEVEALVGEAVAGGSEFALEAALDCVNVVLATVTKAVEMVEMVIVVVGSFAGSRLLEEIDVLGSAGVDEDADVTAAGEAELGSEVAATGVALELATGRLVVAIAELAADDANVASAAAPVRVVKPAVGPLKVADMVTKITDASVAGCAPCADPEDVEDSAAVVLCPAAGLAEEIAAGELAVI